MQATKNGQKEAPAEKAQMEFPVCPPKFKKGPQNFSPIAQRAEGGQCREAVGVEGGVSGERGKCSA